MEEEQKPDPSNYDHVNFNILDYVLENRHEKLPEEFTIRLRRSTLMLSVEGIINPEIIKSYNVTDVLQRSDGEFLIILSKKLFQDEEE